MTNELALLSSCVGTNGLWADPVRYKRQCWTRDLSLAMQPAARLIPGGIAAAERHLRSLARLQTSDGSIPILFLDGARGHLDFLATKLWRTIRDRRISFMLRRYLTGNLGRLTPGTTDSELHFARAVLMHAERGGSPQVAIDLASHVERAIAYIANNLCDVRGLLLGADWRDTMDEVLKRKALLSNNAMWYDVLRRSGRGHEAARVRNAVSGRLCGGLGDYDLSGAPDPLGLALGVLSDMFDRHIHSDVVAMMRSVDSPCGVTILCKHSAYSVEERDVIERTGGVVVWPFVVGYAILALRKIGTAEALALAQEQTDKLRNIDCAEWYDPATGKGYGSPAQGWSASLRAQVL